jgi:hypothetical protein
MDKIALTKENLDKIVKDTIGTAPESIINLVEEKLDSEGSNSVSRYLFDLHKACQNRGFGPHLDEYMDEFINDCFAITDACEKLECRNLE